MYLSDNNQPAKLLASPIPTFKKQIYENKYLLIFSSLKNYLNFTCDKSCPPNPISKVTKTSISSWSRCRTTKP